MEKAREGDKQELEAAPSMDMTPRSRDLVMDKIIQVMELLEKRTRELVGRLNVAEVKIAPLTVNKPLEVCSAMTAKKRMG